VDSEDARWAKRSGAVIATVVVPMAFELLRRSTARGIRRAADMRFAGVTVTLRPRDIASDAHAPMWWVLANAEGNEACVATWVGRE
jgi:CO/xanthine dehydrogenase FAD-binding subunit